jgi:hypothetical protein
MIEKALNDQTVTMKALSNEDISSIKKYITVAMNLSKYKPNQSHKTKWFSLVELLVIYGLNHNSIIK